MWNNFHYKLRKNAVPLNINLKCLVNIERGVDFLLCQSVCSKIQGTGIHLRYPDLTLLYELMR